MSEFFSRSGALLGKEKTVALAAAHVLIVGVGGVGSWCAEALVRTGLGHIALVDDDRVVESNVNRQCPATAKTVGRLKVEAMAERLREINPAVDVRSQAARYAATTGNPGLWEGGSPDVVVDAIDSVDCKARLILDALEAGIPVVSSMGAALRTDPTRVRTSRFEKVEGDGLARALRQRFKRLNVRPGRFVCVWSDEPPRKVDASGPKGSLMPVTATFGMCLAAEVLSILTAGGGR